MPLTLSTPISIARGILNDTDSTSYRYSAADLLQYANDALDQLTALVPQLFYTRGQHTCATGVNQSLSFSTALALVAVERIQDGDAVTKSDATILDLYDPTWRTAASGAAKHWLPVLDDPRRFLVYPPAADTQVLDVIYIAVPPEYDVGDDTGLPSTLADAVADYIVSRAESRDDEHVVNQRAQAFLTSFIQKTKGS